MMPRRMSRFIPFSFKSAILRDYIWHLATGAKCKHLHVGETVVPSYEEKGDRHEGMRRHENVSLYCQQVLDLIKEDAEKEAREWSNSGGKGRSPGKTGGKTG